MHEKLTGSGLFDAETSQQLIADLGRLGDFEHPLVDDEPFDRVTYRVIDWCRAHPEPAQHEHNPDLRR
uniref:hypothetical protein n=1 Tax=Nonomuraea pusilla TaxID=46177 RepID=UPI0006E33198|nr:hypothetical protein [Nonomuraea pusilla]